MTVKTVPHGHSTITAGMSNVFIENRALTRSQHGTVHFTLIRNLLLNLEWLGSALNIKEIKEVVSYSLLADTALLNSFSRSRNNDYTTEDKAGGSMSRKHSGITWYSGFGLSIYTYFQNYATFVVGTWKVFLVFWLPSIKLRWFVFTQKKLKMILVFLNITERQTSLLCFRIYKARILQEQAVFIFDWQCRLHNFENRCNGSIDRDHWDRCICTLLCGIRNISRRRMHNYLIRIYSANYALWRLET